MKKLLHSLLPWPALLGVLCLVAAIYWPGLSGGFLFDDYPNIVDNHNLQISQFNVPNLIGAALSSPSSEFRRPLASLSFALNYLAAGLDPRVMKLTNLVIHLLNGLLFFILARQLIKQATAVVEQKKRQIDITALLIAAMWMVMPINITAVLYIVQRMESMANLFVVLGLIGYVAGRQAMQLAADGNNSRAEWRSVLLCAVSITLPAAIGLLAKETAVLLPLYAAIIEWILFGFRRASAAPAEANTKKFDNRIIVLFALVLVLPMMLGLAWLLPSVLRPESWATRDFTLSGRLYSEARIVVDYIAWTLLPTANALSFYHDDFVISQGLLNPITTLASILFLGFLIRLAIRLRARRPLVSLGIFLFLGCQLLTATVLPLELVYEHRNYFASFGLALAVVPLLSAPLFNAQSFFALPRIVLLTGLTLLWAGETSLTAADWGSPLKLAESLAERAPDSPRAQYELGRTYIIYSHYDPLSPLTALAYPALERAAAIPGSSILPEQALIFMNARMHKPLKQQWWDSMIAKLRSRKAGVQDESSLASLTQCARDHFCDLPKDDMVEAFTSALSHPNPDARLLASYGDYAWNVLDDKALGLSMAEEAVKADPSEPVYLVTKIKMLIVVGKRNNALTAFKQLEAMNYGGELNETLASLRALLDLK